MIAAAGNAESFPAAFSVRGTAGKKDSRWASESGCLPFLAADKEGESLFPAFPAIGGRIFRHVFPSSRRRSPELPRRGRTGNGPFLRPGWNLFPKQLPRDWNGLPEKKSRAEGERKSL